MGVDLATSEIDQYLSALGFKTLERSEDTLSVRVPSFRLDIHEEIDLIEEVARSYGYEQIGKGWSFRATTFADYPPYDQFVDGLCDHMTARGYCELVTSSFTNGREIEDFGWPAGDARRDPIPVRNPLNANHGYLRTSLVPGMLDVIRWNIDHGIRRIRLYQMGRVFLSPGGADKLPEERALLGLAVSYPNTTDFWYNLKRTPDLFDVKQEIEVLLDSFNIDLGPEVHYDFDAAR